MVALRLAKQVSAVSPALQALQNEHSALGELQKSAARLKEVYGGIDSSFDRLGKSARAVLSVSEVGCRQSFKPPELPNLERADFGRLFAEIAEEKSESQVKAIREGIESSPLAAALQRQITELGNIARGLQTANELLGAQVGTLAEQLDQARLNSKEQARANRVQVRLAIAIALVTLLSATAFQWWLSSQSSSSDQAVVQLLQTIANLLDAKL